MRDCLLRHICLLLDHLMYLWLFLFLLVVIIFDLLLLTSVVMLLVGVRPIIRDTQLSFVCIVMLCLCRRLIELRLCPEHLEFLVVDEEPVEYGFDCLFCRLPCVEANECAPLLWDHLNTFNLAKRL